jgi:hypothetical protein
VKISGTRILTGHRDIRECIQKFPDWPSGAIPASGVVLPLGVVVSLFCESF